MKKQIILHLEPATHRWLKGLAARERRTLGGQILAMIFPADAAPAPSRRRGRGRGGNARVERD
jgi:hypothetical protein